MSNPKPPSRKAVQLELIFEEQKLDVPTVNEPTFDEPSADPLRPTSAVKHKEAETAGPPRRTTSKPPPKESKALPKLLPRRV
jgi:hypothetical protein